jgi:hypothetical protein
MGNSTAKEFARSDPTVFSSKEMFKGMKKDVIDPLTKYTADVATIPIKAVKKSMKPIKLSDAMKRDIMNGSKTKKKKK